MCADVRALDLDREFELILAPMQLLQMLGWPSRRAARRWSGRRATWRPGAASRPRSSSPRPARWTALPLPFPTSASSTAGSTRAFRPAALTAGGDLEIRRLRQAVSPDGSLSEEEHADRLDALDADALEAEARDAGPAPGGPARGAAGDGYVGSTVVILERP